MHAASEKFTCGASSAPRNARAPPPPYVADNGLHSCWRDVRARRFHRPGGGTHRVGALAQISRHHPAGTIHPVGLAGRRSFALRNPLRAKPSAAITGRPLGGPIVHRTTGSCASPFKLARCSVRYAFVVISPCGPPDRRRGGLAKAVVRDRDVIRPAVLVACEIVHRQAPAMALQPVHRITESVMRGIVKASRVHFRWQATGLAGTERELALAQVMVSTEAT